MIAEDCKRSKLVTHFDFKKSISDFKLVNIARRYGVLYVVIVST